MTTLVSPELGLMTPAPQIAAEKPQQIQAACLQEQFTGPVPRQCERAMAEILAERLAETDPDSPTPLFIP
jgi:hypothetical protein